MWICELSTKFFIFLLFAYENYTNVLVLELYDIVSFLVLFVRRLK